MTRKTPITLWGKVEIVNLGNDEYRVTRVERCFCWSDVVTFTDYPAATLVVREGFWQGLDDRGWLPELESELKRRLSRARQEGLQMSGEDMMPTDSS